MLPSSWPLACHLGSVAIHPAHPRSCVCLGSGRWETGRAGRSWVGDRWMEILAYKYRLNQKEDFLLLILVSECSSISLLISLFSPDYYRVILYLPFVFCPTVFDICSTTCRPWLSPISLTSRFARLCDAPGGELSSNGNLNNLVCTVLNSRLICGRSGRFRR